MHTATTAPSPSSVAFALRRHRPPSSPPSVVTSPCPSPRGQVHPHRNPPGPRLVSPLVVEVAHPACHRWSPRSSPRHPNKSLTTQLPKKRRTAGKYTRDSALYPCALSSQLGNCAAALSVYNVCPNADTARLSSPAAHSHLRHSPILSADAGTLPTATRRRAPSPATALCRHVAKPVAARSSPRISCSRRDCPRNAAPGQFQAQRRSVFRAVDDCGPRIESA